VVRENTKVRMVRLEINNSGAWKTFIHFDCSDNGFSAEVQSNAALLARCDMRGKLKLRIVTDESLPQVLSYWDPRKGWYDPHAASRL
jgi:hypothetical protein